MNRELSYKLLQNVMNWDVSETENELPILSFMANMKYDSYDQYMPGTRFMASLVQWLSCFDPQERKIMYEFILNDLVFISSTQMSYLVDLLYNSYIKPSLYDKVMSDDLGSIYKMPTDKREKLFNKHKRRALIMGLSDGAHTDVLRRSASFSNEQVLTFYYPSSEKIYDMLSELKDVSEVGMPDKFTSLYLIDDFTASGTSFIRHLEKEDKFKGKLAKILEQFTDTYESKSACIKDLMYEGVIDLHICFCIATEYAEHYLKETVKDFLRKKGLTDRFKLTIDIVQRLENSLSLDNALHKDLIEVIQQDKYICTEPISKSSFKIGKHARPFLGFNEGGLPLVLAHNTPNNSILALWQYNDKSDKDILFKGLFPRISRH